MAKNCLETAFCLPLYLKSSKNYYCLDVNTFDQLYGLSTTDLDDSGLDAKSHGECRSLCDYGKCELINGNLTIFAVT